MFNFTKTFPYWAAISIIVIGLGIAAMAVWGFRWGIDFTGGSLVTLQFPGERPTLPAIQETLAGADLGELVVQEAGENKMVIRLKPLDPAGHKQLLDKLTAQFPTVKEESFETIGPTIGKELRQKSYLAIILVLLFVIIYIAWAFRKVSVGPVSSWVYGVAAILALVHDVLVVVGLYAICGHYWQIDFNLLFVSALLTILGFSIHDTIVVFDRIRESLLRGQSQSFGEIINASINQTLMRSINTSMTTLFVLAALYFFGGETIRWFVLTLIVGIITGTYSSIFIASPLVLLWQKISRK